MQALKIIGILVLVVIGIPLIASIFLPSKVHIERSLSMEAPIKVVFAQVNNVKTWENWDAWHKRDPGMKVEYSGPEEGVGATSTWVRCLEK